MTPRPDTIRETADPPLQAFLVTSSISAERQTCNPLNAECEPPERISLKVGRRACTFAVRQEEECICAVDEIGLVDDDDDDDDESPVALKVKVDLKLLLAGARIEA